MEEAAIIEEIILQLKTDRKNQPSYPDHIAGMAGHVVHHAGNVMGQALLLKYNYGPENAIKDLTKQRIRFNLIKTAAAAIRMLENL